MTCRCCLPRPVKLPAYQTPVPHRTETAAEYDRRVYRWRIWANSTAPMTYYASENEVREFEAWKATL